MTQDETQECDIEDIKLSDMDNRVSNILKKYPSAELKSVDGHTRVILCLFPYSNKENIRDEEYHRAYLYARASGFRAEIEDVFYGAWPIPEIIENVQGFYKSEKSTITICSLEDRISIVFTKDKTGHVLVKCRMVHHELPASLEFEFESDQTYLPVFINGLKEINRFYQDET